MFPNYIFEILETLSFLALLGEKALFQKSISSMIQSKKCP
jgi:hypothetical protein